jgi:acylphosphatase
MVVQRLHATVSGYVQGVGYRLFVVEQARRLDLTGWVRNRSDGTVEVVAEGFVVDLEELLLKLRHGPHQGTVSQIDSLFSGASGEYKQFWYLETD